MAKLELIQGFISRCDKAIENNDKLMAKELQTEIIGVFDKEIPGLRSMLDNYSVYLNGHTVDWLGDIKLLRVKLLNHLINLQEQERDKNRELEIAKLKAVQINNTNTAANANQNAASADAQASANAQLTFEQVIEMITELPEEVLSAEEKEMLEDKLAAVEANKKAKSKGKLAEKVGTVLKYIADKGVEVLIAVLPYLGQIAQAMQGGK